MAEKLAPMYESGLPQKAANLESKAPGQCKSPAEDPQKLTHGGYYSNVAHKGKLILPTALWILLIIAGICFLTLLATLNKSISTLDTLVELEQDKEARAIVSEHLRRHRPNQELANSDSEFKKRALASKKATEKKARKQQQQQQPPPDEINVDGLTFHRLNDELVRDLELSDSGPSGWVDLGPPGPASWFAMPSWASLEPSHHEHRGRGPPVPAPPAGLLDAIFAGMPALGPEAPDSMGGIIVATAPATNEPQPERWQQPGDGWLGPIFKQVAPVFDFLGAAGDERRARSEHKNRLATTGDDSMPGLISAKIGTVNININPPSEQQARLDELRRHDRPTREEQINSLGKSIDDLLENLTEQQQPIKVGRHHQKQHHNRRPDAEPQFEEFSPVGTRHRPQAGPAADLLTPFQQMHSLEQAIAEEMLAQPATMKHDDHRNRHNHHQPDAQLIIAIANDEPEVRLPSGETNRHQVSNTRRPSFGQSPYESAVLTPVDMADPFELGAPVRPAGKFDYHSTKASHGGPSQDEHWNMLAGDLAQALVDDMLGQNGQPKQGQTPEHLIVFDGRGPAPAHEQQALLGDLLAAAANSAELAELDKARQPADIFSAILGPVIGEPKLDREKSTTTPQVAPSGTSSGNKTPEASTIPVSMSTPSSQSSEPKSEPTMSPEAQAKVSAIIGQLPTSAAPASSAGADEKLAREQADGLMDDLMSTMFTLPQMAGDKQEASTAAAKPSGAPSGQAQMTTPSSSVSAASFTSTTTTTTTTTTTKRPEPSRGGSIFSKVLGFFQDPRPASGPTNATRTTPVPSAATTRASAQEAPTRPATRAATFGQSPAAGVPQTSTLAPPTPGQRETGPAGSSAAPLAWWSPSLASEPASASEAITTTSTRQAEPRPSSTSAPEPSAGPGAAPGATPGPPAQAEKSLLERADDFIARNIKSLAKLLHQQAGGAVDRQ